MLIILNEVKKLVIKYTWRKLFPVYTKDEYKGKVAEQMHKTKLHVDRGECRKAVNARRKRAQYQLKVMRITYEEDLRLIKERCKSNKGGD